MLKQPALSTQQTSLKHRPLYERFMKDRLNRDSSAIPTESAPAVDQVSEFTSRSRPRIREKSEYLRGTIDSTNSLTHLQPRNPTHSKLVGRPRTGSMYIRKPTNNYDFSEMKNKEVQRQSFIPYYHENFYTTERSTLGVPGMDKKYLRSNFSQICTPCYPLNATTCETSMHQLRIEPPNSNNNNNNEKWLYWTDEIASSTLPLRTHNTEHRTPFNGHRTNVENRLRKQMSQYQISDRTTTTTAQLIKQISQPIQSDHLIELNNSLPTHLQPHLTVSDNAIQQMPVLMSPSPQPLFINLLPNVSPTMDNVPMYGNTHTDYAHLQLINPLLHNAAFHPQQIQVVALDAQTTQVWLSKNFGNYNIQSPQLIPDTFTEIGDSTRRTATPPSTKNVPNTSFAYCPPKEGLVSSNICDDAITQPIQTTQLNLTNLNPIDSLKLSTTSTESRPEQRELPKPLDDISNKNSLADNLNETALMSSSFIGQSNTPRIGCPPRTLKILDKPDSRDQHGRIDDGNRTVSNTVREPQKLDPSKYVLRSQKPVEPTDIKADQVSETVKTLDTDTLDQTHNIAPINNYYQQIKRQSSQRKIESKLDKPVKPEFEHESKIREVKPVINTTTTTTTTNNNNEKVEYDLIQTPRRNKHVTYRLSKSPSRSPDPTSVNGSDRKERDPSIMSVAELAKHWQQTGKIEHRYSLGGFIDQDLVDCQELVPVEDRVKMFDHMFKENRKVNQNPDLLSELEELRNRKQGKFDRMNTIETYPQTSTMGLVQTNHGLSSVMSLRRIRKEKIPTVMVSSNLINTNNSTKYEDDKSTKLSIKEKRALFGGYETMSNSSNSSKRSIARHKTQPITLDDLARANQLILERYNEQYRDCDKEEYSDIFGLHEQDLLLSVSEISLLSK